MKFGIVVFPGSHGAEDCNYALRQILGKPATYLWHKENDLQGVDCVLIPGGYSFGNYLRPGAIARFSPITKKILRFAQEGGLVLGLDNGFQILTEIGLLPGALIKNASLRFQCQNVYLRIEQNQTPFTNLYPEKEIVQMSFAQEAGCYVADEETLKGLEEEKRVVFRYCTAEGEITEAGNPNGSVNNIAGIVNEQGNVLGLMPRPERCGETILGGIDGAKVFTSLVAGWSGGGQS